MKQIEFETKLMKLHDQRVRELNVIDEYVNSLCQEHIGLLKTIGELELRVKNLKQMKVDAHKRRIETCKKWRDIISEHKKNYATLERSSCLEDFSTECLMREIAMRKKREQADEKAPDEMLQGEFMSDKEIVDRV